MPKGSVGSLKKMPQKDIQLVRIVFSVSRCVLGRSLGEGLKKNIKKLQLSGYLPVIFAPIQSSIPNNNLAGSRVYQTLNAWTCGG
jgi:hypothetical protein